MVPTFIMNDDQTGFDHFLQISAELKKENNEFLDVIKEQNIKLNKYRVRNKRNGIKIIKLQERFCTAQYLLDDTRDKLKDAKKVIAYYLGDDAEHEIEKFIGSWRNRKK